MGAAILYGISFCFAQNVNPDSIANNSTGEEKDAKLGARIFLGGHFGLSPEVENALHAFPQVYGAHIGGLFPVGSQFDISLCGSIAHMPGASYTRPLTASENMYRIAYIALSAPGTPLPPTEKSFTILPSQIVAFNAGIRLYARVNKADVLVRAMSRKLQRPFWRNRVNRSGFHCDVRSGPEVGIHRRLVRTMPESWPVNEPIPESAMQTTNETYQRWYWSAYCGLGWTFNGRVDLALGIAESIRFQGDANSQVEEGADAYARMMYRGSLSIILGRYALDNP
ncbi:MAG: hypothetical protein IT225_06380 [Flavobacteriales bacterium]|nr:hypothetical protein [Flavobacteriales bacterium]